MILGGMTFPVVLGVQEGRLMLLAPLLDWQDQSNYTRLGDMGDKTANFKQLYRLQK